MKSLKAKFKKADVSAIPRDLGTRGLAWGCPRGHGDLPWDDPSFTGRQEPALECPRGHGDLPRDVPNFTGM